MPLEHSASKAAVSRNISELMHSGRPQKQAIAIALSEQRRNRADGGAVDPGMVARYATMPTPQLINLEDQLDGSPQATAIGNVLRHRRVTREAKFAAGGHTIGPVASGYLKGTTAGRTDEIKTKAPEGSYVIPADIVSGMGEGNSDAGAIAIQEMLDKAASPQPEPGRAMGGSLPRVRAQPVRLSHGEFVVAPHYVAAFGNGDPKRGIKWFDKWVVTRRKSIISKMQRLPGPVKV